MTRIRFNCVVACSLIAGALALATIFLLVRPLSADTAADPARSAPASIVPYLTYQGEKDGARLYVVHYFTLHSVESILITSARSDALETLKHHEAVQRAKMNDQAYFSERGTTLDLFRGKRGGSTDYSDIVSYRVTFHRHRIHVKDGQPVAYLIYNGHELQGPYVLRVASTAAFRAVHLGHTRGNYVPSDGPFVTYSPHQIEQLETLRPELLLHSGDIFLSVYDWNAAYRETIEAFRTILPSTPLLIAASNHDQGWPRQNGFPADSHFFSYFLSYPYADSTLNYMVDYRGYRFLMVNYLDYRHHAQSFERRLRRWITTSPHPVVIVWGGSLHTEKLIALVAQCPKVRLILGGDGGRYQKKRLAHDAYLIHNGHKLITLTFTPQEVVAEVRDHRGAVRDQQTIATASQKMGAATD